MGLNAYFGPIQKNRPHATPNYGPVKYKFEVHYYKQTYFFPLKIDFFRRKMETPGQ